MAPWVCIADMSDTDPPGLSQIWSNLGPHDLQRFATFGSKKRQREFLLGRWLLCRAAIAWLGETTKITFDSTSSGSLHVRGPKGCPPITASLSHASDWFACALTFNGSIGIDIEPIIDRDFVSMDDLAFSENGHPPLSQVPIDVRPQEFYKRWTLHEARFKFKQAEHLPSPFIEHTCIIHNRLMLSFCIAKSGSDKKLPGVMEWVHHTGFQICESVDYQ